MTSLLDPWDVDILRKARRYCWLIEGLLAVNVYRMKEDTRGHVAWESLLCMEHATSRSRL